jgi:hypothetical protein
MLWPLCGVGPSTGDGLALILGLNALGFLLRMSLMALERAGSCIFREKRAVRRLLLRQQLPSSFSRLT